MKGKSLYKLYQLYFGYESASSDKQKINYAISITEAVKILEESYEKKNFKSIEDYLAKPKKRQLTANFLNNFLNVLEKEFASPFVQAKYIPSQINVSKEYLLNRNKDIIFECPYIEDYESDRIIILAFSTPKNMIGEISVLKGLIHQFKIDRPFSKSFKNICYCDLSKGDMIEKDYSSITSVSRENLVEVLIRL